MNAAYSALVSAWNASSASAGALPSGVAGASLFGLSTDAKIAALNAWTIAGPPCDVQPADVVAYLALNGKFAALLKYAQSPPATPAGVAAANFAAVIGLGSNAPVFGMSNPTTYAAIEGMLTAVASDSNSGLQTSDVTALMALSATTTPWWQSVGLTSPVNTNDLAAAGGLT